MDTLKKKYTRMENVLININSKIALQTNEKKRNNIIMIKVTETIVNLMKQKDQLFSAMYEKNYYGGSYYDNLKVGNPNEYDLDLVLNLPNPSTPCIECNRSQPGYVCVILKDYSKILSKPEAAIKSYEKISTLLDSRFYLSTTKVLQWIERLVSLALNDLPKDKNGTYVDVVLDKNKPEESLKIYLRTSKCGPAFTMKLSGKDIDSSNIQLDIDLVPCFQFTKNKWPDTENGYRPNPSTRKDNFMVVPKKPKGEALDSLPYVERFWRLSFQEQERELIGQNLKNLKPSLRLLKKLRDSRNHNIASYFIKTIFLWTLQEEESTFWSQSLSIVFMSMLKKYAQRIREQNIPYYWNEGFNLIGNLKEATKTDMANTLQKIINDVERHLTEPLIDPYTIGKYLLSSEEYQTLKKDVSLGKKLERNITVAAASAALSNNSPTVDTPDAAVDDSPPLVKVLKFDPTTLETYKQYSDQVEERQRHFFEDIMSQINQKSDGSLNNSDILTSLSKIDEKMDKMLEKFDKTLQNNTDTNLRLISLEEQVRQLQLENRDLRTKIHQNETGDVTYVNSVDPILTKSYSLS